MFDSSLSEYFFTYFELIYYHLLNKGKYNLLIIALFECILNIKYQYRQQMNSTNQNYSPQAQQPLRNNYHINPAQSKLVYQNPKQLYQQTNIPNNYIHQPQNIPYQNVVYQQNMPIYQNNNVRPNSYDHAPTMYNNQVGNAHYVYNSPPLNVNRAVTYNNGSVQHVQSFPIQQQQSSSHVYNVAPVIQSNQDVRFNYAVNQPAYSVTSQPLYKQENVIMTPPPIQNNPSQINNQIQPPPQLQNTVVQNSTVVTAVMTTPPVQNQPAQTHQRQSSQQQSVNPIWQQRFIMIYQKFEWFYQRYEFITRQFTVLSQDFQNVNSEDEWLELKEKHDLLLQKIQQIQEQLINTIQQNQQLAEQYEIQNRNSKDTDQGERVWQHRYHQLLEQYQSLSQNYADLQSQGNVGGSGHNEQLQQRYNQIQHEYNALYEEYQKMQQQFKKMHSQNSQLAQTNQQAISYSNKLQVYVQELQAQNQHLTEQLKRSSIQGGGSNGIPTEQVQQMEQEYNQQLGRYQEQMQQYLQQMQNRNHQVQQLSHIIVQRQGRIKQLESNVNRSGHSKNQQEDFEVQKNYISRLEHQIKELKQNQNQFVHRLQIKDLQRNSLQKKLSYIEQQYEQKKTQVQRVNKTFEEKLYRIQQNMMAPTQITDSKHSQNKIGQGVNLEAQLQSKNQIIRQLQQRLSEFQLQIRKKANQRNGMLFQFQGKLSAKQLELTKIIAQKDVKISFLNSQKERLQWTIEKKNKQRQLAQKQNQEEVASIQKKYKIKIQQFQQNITSKGSQTDQKLRIATDKISKLQAEISQKNMELGHVVKSSKQSSTKSDKVYQDLRAVQQALQRKNDQINKHKKQKQSKNRQIRELQSQISQTTQQLNKKRVQISGLKRQLSDVSSLQTQLESLRTNLTKKNSQVLQLRNLSFQLQRSKMQQDASRRQSDRLNNQLRERIKQIQNLRESVHQLQRKIRQIGSKSVSYTSNNSYIKDDSEAYELKEALRRKQTQISRISSQLQDLKQKLQESNHEQEVQKSKILTQKKAYQHDQSSLNQKVSALQSRLRQSQNKKQQLIEELSHLRIQFQQQLTIEGQRHKSYYQKVINRNEQDSRLLKQRVRQYQQHANSQELQLQKNRKNQKRLQIQKLQLQRKVAQLGQSMKQKQELFQAFRQKQSIQQSSIKTIYDKLSIVQSKLKTKQQELKISEQKHLVLENKIKKIKKDHENVKSKLIINSQTQNNNSVVQYLSKRIADYESHLLNQSQHDFGFKVKDMQANHVFENQVVYHLKRENQLLRKQLQGKGIHYDRMVLNQIEQQNMKRSRNLLKASTLSSKFNVTQNVQQISFYREKNKQLEERVDKHIRVNKQLKQKLEALVKNNTQATSVQYYKQHITQLQETISQLNSKIDVLAEQNRSFKKGMAKSQIRSQNQYQLRIAQLQLKVKDLTKTNQTLSAQSSELQINRSELIIQKTLLADQIKRLSQQSKNTTANRSQKYQEQIRTLRTKCEGYQLQITKASNKARILQSQIQRLKQTSNVSKLSTTQISNLKTKISELNQLLIQRQNSLHEEELKTNRLSDQLAKWQQKSRFLQNQVTRLNELHELYAKKQKTDLTDSTTLSRSLSSFQIQINNLQSQLGLLSSRNIQLENKVALMSQQLQFYQRLFNQISYQLEFLRSNALQEQALAQELLLPTQAVQETIEAIRVNSNKSLQCLNQMQLQIKRVY